MAHNWKAKVKKYIIKDEYKEKTEEGLSTVLNRLELSLTDDKQARTGGRHIVKNTTNQYNMHYRGLEAFCAMVGDYDSLLMLNEYAPSEYCPSMNPVTIATYLRYKTAKPEQDGTVRKLYEFGTNALVNDVLGNAVLCDGGWKCKSSINQFLGAIGAIHEARGQKGPFTDHCTACIAAFQSDNSSRGCRWHIDKIRLWRTGSPRSSSIIQNAYKEAEDTCKAHVIRGAYQLIPSELIKMRTALLATNKMDDLQLWCIILISICLFLRHDEYFDMELSHIRWDLSIFKDGIPLAITIAVCGKTDRVVKNLILWRKDDVPEYCPIRVLLSYVYLCKIEGKYIFPLLNNRKERRPYATFLGHIKCRFSGILERDNPITTHVFRKTGYLFAKWGGADMDTAMKSARHKNFLTAQMYMGDASGQLDLAIAINPDAKYQVPRFKMSIIINETSARRTLEASFTFPNSLHSVAVDFMAAINVTKHARKTSPQFVMEQALRFSPEPNLGEVLNNLLAQHVAAPVANELRVVVAQLVNEERNKRIAAETVVTLRSNKLDAEESKEQAKEQAAKPKQYKRKRGGTNDLTGRKEVMARGISIENRIERLLELEELVPSSLEELTPSAKTWYLANMKPVLSCLKNHFQNDIDAFVKKYPISGISSFKSTHCHGSGIRCSKDGVIV